MQLEPIRTNERSPGSVVLGRQISSEAQKVLRNTYLLLALTMLPTIGGAFVGMATGGIILQHPIIA
jgi:FtsH-binding integral membrane protein